MKTKLEALAAVVMFASQTRSLVMRSNDGIKIAGLVDKARDARTLLFDPASDPNEDILEAFSLECLERNRGETPEQLAQAILAKANAVRSIRARIDGLEDRMKTAIEMAPNDELAVMTFEGARQLALAQLAPLGIKEEMYL